VKRLALLLILFASACGGDYSGADEADLSEPEAMMLRLSDLPQGFRYGDDRGCGDVTTTEGGGHPELDDFLLESRPRWCGAEFSREWGGPPRSAESALFLFGSEDDARRAWELRKTLFADMAAIDLTRERGQDDAVAFDSKGEYLRGAGEAWRDGQIVVAIYEEGLQGEEGRDFVADLAEKQRERIESPSSPSREDDREIGLEDPAIAIPVYWLGRRFAPEGLPALTLYRGDHIRGAGPGNDVKIDYEGGGSTVTLDLWKPERWNRFKSMRLGRVGWSAPCVRRSILQLDGGRAEIYGGYSKGCDGEPDLWLAHVYFDDVVVAVSASDPYDSRDGMEAVVEGLKRR
jgi:hypothetical protein